MFKIYRYVEDEELEGDSKTSDREEGDMFDDALDSSEEEESTNDESEEFEDSEEKISDEEAGDEEEEDEDPNFQGIIRTVPGACLVYKRKDEKNTYEELWIYNNGGRDIKPEIRIRKSILAGTDIDPKTQRSPDGQQTCETLSVGNVQFLHVRGLVN